MNVKAHSDDDSLEITIELTGAVRSLADGYSGSLEFHGLDETETVFDTYSTVICVTSEDDVDAARDVLAAVRRDEDLKSAQASALTRVERKLEDARAHFWQAEREAEDDTEDDEDGELSWSDDTRAVRRAELSERADEVKEALSQDGVTLEAETEDEAEDLVETLETGDYVEVERHGGTQTYRVTSTDDGRFTGKRVDAHKAGTTTFKPTCVGNYALATHGRGMSSRFGRVEVVAHSIEGHRPEDAETNDAMSEDEAADLLNRGVVVEDMDGDRHRVTVREETGGLHLEPVGDGWASVGAFDMGVSNLVTGVWSPVETVVGTLEDDEDDDGAAPDRVVCTDGGTEDGLGECGRCGRGDEYLRGGLCGDCRVIEGLDSQATGEDEARRTQALGEPKLALDDPADADEATAPFVALDASASDVFVVEWDRQFDRDPCGATTRTFRCSPSDGSVHVVPVGDAEPRTLEAADLDRIEWFGPLEDA